MFLRILLVFSLVSSVSFAQSSGGDPNLDSDFKPKTLQVTRYTIGPDRSQEARHQQRAPTNDTQNSEKVRFHSAKKK